MKHKPIKDKPVCIQNDLFSKYLLQQVSLHVPDSPRKTFYKLYFEFEFNNYVIRKESGVGSKVLDRRIWIYESFEKAEKSFNNRIHQKTRPDRKSSRKYIGCVSSELRAKALKPPPVVSGN